MYEGRRGRKHNKRGRRGACTYCGRVHKKGQSGDGCGGRTVRKMTD